MNKESELTRKIIGIAMKIHREIGPGFQERIYHRAMIVALKKEGLVVESEKQFDVKFQNIWVGAFQLDLLVNYRMKCQNYFKPKLFPI